MGEYKIRDIEKLTGIKAHTLRIWEKRYGILEPNRTDTKIRTYTDSDLTDILNISILYNSGTKISHIANLQKEEINKRVCDLKSIDSSDQVQEKLLLALVEMDEISFSNLLSSIVEEHGLTTMFKDFIIPFFDRIGIMWLVGTINPAQEHFISNIIRQKLIAETDKLEIPDKNKTIILYLPEHEWHEVGLLHFNYILRSNNIYTYYLGQSLPLESLQIAIEKLNPDFVISSWLTAIEKEFVVDYYKQLSSKYPDVHFVCSGFQISNFENDLKPYITPIHSSEDLLSIV